MLCLIYYHLTYRYFINHLRNIDKSWTHWKALFVHFRYLLTKFNLDKWSFVFSGTSEIFPYLLTQKLLFARKIFCLNNVIYIRYFISKMILEQVKIYVLLSELNAITWVVMSKVNLDLKMIMLLYMSVLRSRHFMLFMNK